MKRFSTILSSLISVKSRTVKDNMIGAFVTGSNSLVNLKERLSNSLAVKIFVEMID